MCFKINREYLNHLVYLLKFLNSSPLAVPSDVARVTTAAITSLVVSTPGVMAAQTRTICSASEIIPWEGTELSAIAAKQIQCQAQSNRQWHICTKIEGGWGGGGGGRVPLRFKFGGGLGTSAPSS